MQQANPLIIGKRELLKSPFERSYEMTSTKKKIMRKM
jgi:hypothetical protein